MTKKRLGLVAGAALATAVAAGAVLRAQGGDDGIHVELSPARRATVVQTVLATGRIQPMTQVKVSADVSAKITRLLVEEGQWVEAGDLLLELDRERYVAAVDQTRANLGAATAGSRLARENMVKAEKDRERSRELYSRELESQATMDSVHAAAEVEKARYASAVDGIEQARAAVRRAEDDLAKTTIYAPMSGTVSRLNKEVGEICLGSQFQEDVILEIANLRGMEALVDVDENDIVLVSIGDRADIEVDALPDLVFAGEVTEIASSASMRGDGTTDQRTEFEVKIALTAPDTSLRPGMTASAEIVTDTCEGCLAVPIQSVTVRTPEQLGLEEGGETGGDAPTVDGDGFVEVVWSVDEGAARPRRVSTGIQSDRLIHVVDGLSEGDEVVVGPFRAISRDLSAGAPIAADPAPDAG